MDDSLRPIFEQFGISLALGLLVGLQRQHVAAELAGLRTFPLIALLGSLAATLDQRVGASGWIVAAALLGLAGLLAATTHAKAVRQAADQGLTTEVAILLMFVVGAAVVLADRLVAIAVAATCAVLLEFKGELHGLAARLGDDDLRAIMKFVLITCIVLPVLPNTTYDLPIPWNVLNPFHTWLMVVLVVGISLGGYLIYKFFGQHAGVLLGGLLGGAISSTATTLAYARRTAAEPHAARLAALVVGLASLVVYVRLMIEIFVAAPAHWWRLAAPQAVMLTAGLPALALLWLRLRRTGEKMPEQSNPTELKSAIVFGLLYAGVLVALATAKQYLDNRALYGVAVLSGLTDMDAITLSTARLVQAGGEEGLSPAGGWRLIVVGVMTNLAFKNVLALALGGCRLALYVALAFALPLVAGGALLALWN